MQNNKNEAACTISFETVCQSTADVLDNYVCNIQYFCEDSNHFYLSATSDRLFEPDGSVKLPENIDDTTGIPLFLRVHKQKDEDGSHFIEGCIFNPLIDLEWTWYSNIY